MARQQGKEMVMVDGEGRRFLHAARILLETFLDYTIKKCKASCQMQEGGCENVKIGPFCNCILLL